MNEPRKNGDRVKRRGRTINWTSLPSLRSPGPFPEWRRMRKGRTGSVSLFLLLMLLPVDAHEHLALHPLGSAHLVLKVGVKQHDFRPTSIHIQPLDLE